MDYFGNSMGPVKRGLRDSGIEDVTHPQLHTFIECTWIRIPTDNYHVRLFVIAFTMQLQELAKNNC